MEWMALCPPRSSPLLPCPTLPTTSQVGDVLPLKVIEFDKEAKKIVLSAVEYCA
jgi:hypothetical protein